MGILFYLLLPIVAIGQLAISVALVNRIHSLGYPRWILKMGDYACYLLTAGLPIAVGIWYLRNIMAKTPQPTPTWIIAYMSICAASILVFIGTRIYHNRSIKPTPRLVSNHTQVVHVTKRLGYYPVGDSERFTRFCANLPLNEIFQLSIHDKELEVPRLDPRLSGLRITHLSDLHMTGQLTQAFYEEVVRQANELDSDIVAITGDIVEKVPCLEWIPETLGQLRSKYGVYFVFGNHERRIYDEARTRTALTDAGLIDLGGKSAQFVHNGATVLLGGNELPWYKPPVDFGAVERKMKTGDDGQRPLRIVLTHSPDQLNWARENDCDLMLAGHTHGGQVRLPLVGAILAPSRMGTRYASGTFYNEPTLMHVSRGVAGTRPLRLNCRPEIARLTLRS